MRTREFQVRNYSVKYDYANKYFKKYQDVGNKNTEQSHKYCSALAHRRKGLRLKWEDENVVKIFSYEIQVCSVIFMPQGHHNLTTLVQH